PEHAEDDGQAARDEEEEQAVFDAVEQLHREQRRRHVAIEQPKAGSSASFCARPRTSSRPSFTWRTSTFWTGLWVLPKRNGPRGLSVRADSSAAMRSFWAEVSPCTLSSACARRWMVSYPATA